MTSTKQDLLDEILPDIRAAAKTVAYKWPGITTAEDLTNDLVVRFLETEGSMVKLVELPVPDRRKLLVRAGNQIAASMRDDFEVFSGQYRYSVDDVKEALSKGALKGSNSYNVQALDILEAATELRNKNQPQFEILIDRYVNGVQPKTGQMKMGLSRAVEHLTRILNRADLSAEYDYENGGRYRNNKSALNQIDQDYEGEGRYDW